MNTHLLNDDKKLGDISAIIGLILMTIATVSNIIPEPGAMFLLGLGLFVSPGLSYIIRRNFTRNVVKCNTITLLIASIFVISGAFVDISGVFVFGFGLGLKPLISTSFIKK